MFDDLRRAFREAVANFKEELGRDDVPEVVDQLLRQMVDEMTDARAYLKKLDVDIELAERRLEKERSEAATALRRQSMAAGIGDDETARIALEYAEKHARNVEILEQKLAAFREERTVRTADVEQMTVKFKEARAQRESLTATAGRTQTRGALGEADRLFDELDRMEAKIRGTDHDTAAADEVSEALGNSRPRDPELEREFDDLAGGGGMSVEERLEELKRRMGK